MRFHAEARRDAYDAIVVGSGIGGLTAAALLARSGRSVLVVERHDRPGGYAHAFRRGRFLFDSAVHLVGGCEPVTFEGGGLVHRLLDGLGVRDLCEFERVEPCYVAHYPDLSLRVPSRLEEFVAAHARLFPAEEKGLQQLVQDCFDIRREMSEAEALSSPLDALHVPNRFPTVRRYRRATLADVMASRLEEPRLRALFASLWPYLGLPPSRLSFLYWATMLMTYVADGSYYCRGSFQNLARALVAALQSSGGEILYRSPVRRIVVRDGCVSGVVLENGQRVDAPVVVSNADACQTVEELVGSEAFGARSRARLRRLERSVSAFVVYAATDLDLTEFQPAHENFFYTGWSHEEAFRGVEAAEPSWFTATIPTLSDPGLAPAGQHLMTLTTLVPSGGGVDWRAEKERFTERLLSAADACFPGLRDHLLFAEGATPRTMERYTRNPGGAIYGFAVTPQQVGPGRPGNETEIGGLYLAGHWTQPGGGIYGVMASGIQAARQIHGREPGFWEGLSS